MHEKPFQECAWIRTPLLVSSNSHCLHLEPHSQVFDLPRRLVMFLGRPIKGAADELDKIPGFQAPRFRSQERSSYPPNNPSSSTELGAQLVAIDSL